MQGKTDDSQCKRLASTRPAFYAALPILLDLLYLSCLPCSILILATGCTMIELVCIMIVVACSLMTCFMTCLT